MALKRFLCSCVILKREHHFILLERRQSPPARFSVMKQSGEHFHCFFCFVPQRTRVKHVRWWKMLSGLCLCLHLTLSAVFRPFTDFNLLNKWTVYTSCVDNGDQQEPESHWSHLNMEREMIQSIYCMMMNKPDALSLRRRCIHVVKTLLQCCSRSL